MPGVAPAIPPGDAERVNVSLTLTTNRLVPSSPLTRFHKRYYANCGVPSECLFVRLRHRHFFEGGRFQTHYRLRRDATELKIPGRAESYGE